MKVLVDLDKCCSSGLCVLKAPEVFDQRDEDGLVILLDATPPESSWDGVRAAVRMCPSQAIAVEEPEG